MLQDCTNVFQSCEGVTEAYDWIEGVFAELKEFSDRLNKYMTFEIDEALKRKITAVLTL
jgi:hypothetical protein